MERFPEKLKTARKAAGINQTELAEAVGVTQRSLTNYECGRAVPHTKVMIKLAAELGVTVEYLTNDATDDPDAGRKREEQINMARSMFGGKAAKEASDVLSRGAALFAGGELSQEAKDVFFEALMAAYLDCKTAAREKFTPKSRKG